MHPTSPLFETATPPTSPLRLRAGPVSAWLELESGSLRRITCAGREVVRGIYGAVRDRNWGTVTPQLHYHQLDQYQQSFGVRFTALCRLGEIHFVWNGHITGAADGSIRYEFDGTAQSAFHRNRIGLCVLHPLAGCAGQPCEVQTTDGAWQPSEFPRFIAPHQPFQNLRSIRHEVAPAIRVEVRFEGETFEMEDQRNWTDASFKTYGTPLALPFPVAVGIGERIRQFISIRFDGEPAGMASVVDKSPAPVNLTVVPGPTLRRPALGFCLSEDQPPPSARQLDWIRNLAPDHLRTEVRLGRGGWQTRLAEADATARRTGATLHLALHFTDHSQRELAELQDNLRRLASPVALLLVFQQGHRSTPHPLLGSVLSWAAATLPGVPVAAGTDAFFAELNRARLPSGSPALPCFSVNPQVHASDTLSCTETLEAQPQTVESAAHFTGQAVVVSPITLRMRWNPNATGPEPDPTPGELPASVDPRQRTLLGAAWTLGSLARLLPHPQVHSLTYYELVGWRGLIESEAGSPAPACFPSIPCERFPVYRVFLDLARTAVRPCPLIDHPDRIAALGLMTVDGKSRLLVANLTAVAQTLQIQGIHRPAHVIPTQAEDPGEWNSNSAPDTHRLGIPLLAGPHGLSLDLAPYAYARVDEH